MNKENATVTLLLTEFDKLREGDRAYRDSAPQIADCFDYRCKDLVVSEDCRKCNEENPDCMQCEVYKANPPYEETLTVDVERLISVCKQYALYGKEVYSCANISEMKIIIKGAAEKKAKLKSTKPKSKKGRQNE